MRIAPFRTVLLCACVLASAAKFQLQRPALHSLKQTKRLAGFDRSGAGSVPIKHEAALSSDAAAQHFQQEQPTLVAAALPAKLKLKLPEHVKISLYIAVWYGLSIYYNTKTKRLLNYFPAPYTLSAAHFLFGIVYCAALWLTKLREVPYISKATLKQILPVGLLNTAAHVGAVVSIAASSVSFTQVIKASEPFFSAVFAALLLNQFFHWSVYASLVPIVGGVAMVSMNELQFRWEAFNGATLSNIATVLRNILSKAIMQQRTVSAANLYALMTICGFIFTLPVALVKEPTRALQLFKSADAWKLWQDIILSSASYYLYNEVAFMALDHLHPVTHAVVNTIKRVIVIAVSIVVFKTPITSQGIAGSGVALIGVFLYSVLKQLMK
jgi:solute carrier family 35 protein E1